MDIDNEECGNYERDPTYEYDFILSGLDIKFMLEAIDFTVQNSEPHYTFLKYAINLTSDIYTQLGIDFQDERESLLNELEEIEKSGEL